MFAALGPLLIADDAIVGKLSKAVGRQPSDIQRVLGALLDAGVLREDRGRARIIPDVLADHILTDTLLASGKATGFERENPSEYGDSCSSRVRTELAELQWQFSETGNGPISFLRPGARWWSSSGLSTNWDRMQLVEQLTAVAVFQPVAVLDLCEWVTDMRMHSMTQKMLPSPSGVCGGESTVLSKSSLLYFVSLLITKSITTAPSTFFGGWSW